MRVLVAIASYGTGNDAYLSRLIGEYRSMPYQLEIVVFSNLPKNVGPGVRIAVGLPEKDPRSLPFAHKQFLAERAEQHDLFIYSEDDTLVTQENVEAFLRLTEVLPKNEIAGFLRSVVGENGARQFCGVHAAYHWDPGSVRRRGPYTVAFFTNEHAACYMLTRNQLKKAVASGGFLVPFHEGKHEPLETAATDPYTQCGFKKVVCISHLQDFTLPHLSNKYVGTLCLDEAEFQKQINVLKSIERGEIRPVSLLNAQTNLRYSAHSKSYYEAAREDILSLIPIGARTVLSVGCGVGKLEERLTTQGIRVSGIPLDPVIGACAEARGVELVMGNFAAALRQLNGRQFDCMLMLNILHLIPDPEKILAAFSRLLSRDGIVVVAVPNFGQVTTVVRRLLRRPGYEALRDDQQTGVHLTSLRVVRKWFKHCGLSIAKVNCVIPARGRLARSLSLGLADRMLAEELLIAGRLRSLAPVDTRALRRADQRDSRELCAGPIASDETQVGVLRGRSAITAKSRLGEAEP